MDEKKKKHDKKSFVRNTLRRASMRWPPRNEALSLARIERGLYRCAMCQEGFKREQVDIDHVLPVVDIKNGFTNWDDFVERLLPEVEGFQILCKTCHESKTMLEDHMRTNAAEMERIRVKEEKKKKKEEEKMKKHLEYLDKKKRS